MCDNTATSSTPHYISWWSVVNIYCKFRVFIFNHVRRTAILLDSYMCNPIEKYSKKWKTKWNYSTNNNTSLNLVSVKENLVMRHSADFVRYMVPMSRLILLIYRWYEAFEKGRVSVALKSGSGTRPCGLSLKRVFYRKWNSQQLLL